MKRTLVDLIAGVLIGTVPFFSIAHAAYPDKPIKIVVPFAPGGIADATARAVAQGLSKRLQQSVIVENRPGGAAIIGISAVAKAPPDGYTLLLGSTNISTNPALYKKLPYDAEKELAPVALVMLLPAALIVPSSLPVKSFKELLTYAKENPGKIAYSSVGLGSYPHLAIESLVQKTATTMTHVPYKGFAPATLAVLSGEVQLLASDLPSALQYIQSGKVRALAVTGTERSPVLPTVPTVQEEGVKGYETLGWLGIMAPAGTPKEIVTLLNTEINKILQTRDVQQRFAEQGVDIPVRSIEEFDQFLAQRKADWGKVIKAGKISLD
jgi:tripartite-type tricarboxylate transporter receptor subunit TctC